MEEIEALLNNNKTRKRKTNSRKNVTKENKMPYQNQLKAINSNRHLSEFFETSKTNSSTRHGNNEENETEK